MGNKTAPYNIFEISLLMEEKFINCNLNSVVNKPTYLTISPHTKNGLSDLKRAIYTTLDHVHLVTFEDDDYQGRSDSITSLMEF